MPHIDIHEAIVVVVLLVAIGWIISEIKAAADKSRDGDWP